MRFDWYLSRSIARSRRFETIVLVCVGVGAGQAFGFEYSARGCVILLYVDFALCNTRILIKTKTTMKTTKLLQLSSHPKHPIGIVNLPPHRIFPTTNQDKPGSYVYHPPYRTTTTQFGKIVNSNSHSARALCQSMG